MGLLAGTFRLKLIALGVALGMWVAVVYVPNPPEIRTVDVPVTTSLLRANLVLLHPVGRLPVKVAGLAANVASRRVGQQLTASLDLHAIRRAGVYNLPVRVVNTDPNVAIWSHPPRVTVVVDQLAEVHLPVHVTVTHSPPPGYVFDGAKTSTSPAAATVSGPATLLGGLSASINADLSKLRATTTESLAVILTRDGRPAKGFTVVPTFVSVQLVIASRTTPRTVAVTLGTIGPPPTGYQIVSVQYAPLTVIATGTPAALNGLTGLVTGSLSLAGATGTFTETVRLVIPTDISVSRQLVSVTFTLKKIPIPKATRTPTPTPSPSPSVSP